MANKYKCVQINLEESFYNHFKKYIDSYLPDTDMSYFLKSLVIYRAMELRILNEVGMPNDFIFGPEIDFSAFDSSKLGVYND